MACGAPFDFGEFFAERIEKGVAGLRDSAAENDGFGVEDIDERGKGAGEGSDGREPDAAREFIAAAIRVDQGVRCFKTTLGALADVPVADRTFQRAGHPGDARRPVNIQARVA